MNLYTMHYLALDLGTQCGWSTIYPDGSGITAGVWDLRVGRFEGGGMRFLRFRQRLRETLPGSALVVYEEVRRHMGTDAAHVYGGLQAVLTEECEIQKIPYESVPVGTVKKFATGKGNSNKATMIEAAEKLGLPFPIKDDNMADAIHIARWACHHHRAA